MLVFLISALPAHAVTCEVPGNRPTFSQAVRDPNCDTINLGAGTFVGPVTIERDLTINGAGFGETVVDGQGQGTAITVEAGSVTLNDITVANGNGSFGGGIFNGDEATLRLNRVALRDNVASIIGGGLDNRGNAILTDVVVADNASQFGGGISTSGTLRMTGVTLQGNEAGTAGGGLRVRSGTARLLNVTVYGNTAVPSDFAGEGGGVYVQEGLLKLSHVTLSGNLAKLGGGVFVKVCDPGEGCEQGVVEVKGSILAHNEGDNCGRPLSSLGHNLSTDASCAAFLTQAGDRSEVEVNLDPAGPQDNGGATPTVALLAGSPAVDAIPAEACADADGNAVAADQRGVSRPQRGGCDIGAFEVRG